MEVVKKLGDTRNPSSRAGEDHGGIHDLASEEWAVEVKSYEEPAVKINHCSTGPQHRQAFDEVALTSFPDGDGKTLPEYIDEMINGQNTTAAALN